MEPVTHALPDGTTITLRAIRPDDNERMLAMWDRTSAESRRKRFLGPFTLDERSVQRFTNLNPDLQFAVVACRGRETAERIVGVARYERDPDMRDHAEFAALVEDGEQGRGVGTALVRTVAQMAAAAGITHLSGDILADNTRMLNLVRELGLEFHSRRDVAGVIHSDLDVATTANFLEVVETSEREAAQAAIRRFLRPERIAVVGASRNPQSIGGMVFDNLLQGRFTGTVYPVNPYAESVQSVAAYSNLRDCPQVPDLVVVCVPSALVPQVVEDAGDLGVAAVCIITAGFAEVDHAGEQRQDELLATARGYGLRIVGPNCMGLLNGSLDVRMNATFSTAFPSPGRISMSSQSGALGLAVLAHVHALGLGMSTFVSVGNKSDISGNDLLQYWEDDPDTDVILMYLESFGNPRKFSRIARRVSRHKPIVAVKSGRTSAGVRAASSHTAAIASGDSVVEALFQQTGVIRTDTLEEMFDVATLLSGSGLPSGTNVGIVTNAGGPAILAADALESYGLDVPRLSDRTVAHLREFLPAAAAISNPIDMIASASADHYRRCVEVLGNAGEIDVVFVIYIPVGTDNGDAVARELVTARERINDDVPVVSVFMSSGPAPDELASAKMPTFAFPESAARAIGRVAQYARWRQRPLGRVITPEDLNRDRARHVTDQAVPDRDGWLDYGHAVELLDAYGISVVKTIEVTDPDEARNAFLAIDGPVAVKVASSIHKADVGGVQLGLSTADEVVKAIAGIRQRLADQDLARHGERFLIQQQVTAGIEMVVGVTHDPSFGPVIVTGMGGTLVELLHDVSTRITPLTDRDVDEMLDELRMRPLLRGYRGSPPADIAALKDLLHRMNAMVEDLPEIRELDLNPVFVGTEGSGATAVDVRMRLATS